MSLYLIEILHQTTTMYDFYMKDMELYLIEILHQTTTPFEGFCPLSELYLIEILHQTTTSPRTRTRSLQVVSYRNSTSNHNGDPTAIAQNMLYLIEILHQTTTLDLAVKTIRGCILSKFYIKPQRQPVVLTFQNVVSYRNSTSNHNNSDGYPVVTKLYLIEILHQTTTLLGLILTVFRCILSKFYIKPQRNG